MVIFHKRFNAQVAYITGSVVIHFVGVQHIAGKAIAAGDNVCTTFVVITLHLHQAVFVVIKAHRFQPGAFGQVGRVFYHLNARAGNQPVCFSDLLRR